MYSAYLNNVGEKLTVKVLQCPYCTEIIALGIYMLQNLSRLMNQLIKHTGRKIGFQKISDEFNKLTYEEIYYISEAFNDKRFLDLYGGLPEF